MAWYVLWPGMLTHTVSLSVGYLKSKWHQNGEQVVRLFPPYPHSRTAVQVSVTLYISLQCNWLPLEICIRYQSLILQSCIKCRTNQDGKKISTDWNNKSSQKKTLHRKKSILLLYDITKSPLKADKALWPRLCRHPPPCHSSTCPPANTYCELLLGVWQTLSNFPTPPQHISSIRPGVTSGQPMHRRQSFWSLCPYPLPNYISPFVTGLFTAHLPLDCGQGG